ncbi:acyl--CoA ligase [Caldifermentibacillus hisashii]|uniref:acyl-CoA synthetase MbcS n=1 Tax=Caldifermentibacillus hisashii TaxID=996558 RepID=UPI0031FD83AE
MINLIAPEYYNFTEEVEKFSKDPYKVAIKWVGTDGSEKNITYVSLVEKMNRYANALVNLGLKKGDRVLIITQKVPESYYIYLACLKAGLVMIPCSEMLRAKDLTYRINHSEASAVIVYNHLTNEVDSITEPIPTLKYKLIIGEHETEGWTSVTRFAENESAYFVGEKTKRDEMALLPYTSGTTGNPKAVVHNHGWFFAHLQIAPSLWLDIKEGDLVWATAAPGWQKWIWSPFVSTIGMGATAFVYNGRFDAANYLQLLQKYQVNVLCCTPTEYRFMAKLNNLSDYSLPALRSAVSAGEPLNVQVIETFQKEFGITVRDGYGQTENTLLIGTLPGTKLKKGSMGKAIPGYQVEIINHEGKPCAIGEVGDIAVHKSTPTLFKEYYKDFERTQKAYRGDWYLTGDQAKKDEDGYFWYEGRSDDIIISSGYTIGPFEVEDALTKHPLVRECAVVASPDPDRGNVVKAFVVLVDPHMEKGEDLIAKLQEHVKNLTAPYKYPRKIEFVEELPKTASGKIRRVELRQKEMQQPQK